MGKSPIVHLTKTDLGFFPKPRSWEQIAEVLFVFILTTWRVEEQQQDCFQDTVCLTAFLPKKEFFSNME